MATLKERAREANTEYRRIHQLRNSGDKFVYVDFDKVNPIMDKIGEELLFAWMDTLSEDETACVDGYLFALSE